MRKFLSAGACSYAMLALSCAPAFAQTQTGAPVTLVAGGHGTGTKNAPLIATLTAPPPAGTDPGPNMGAGAPVELVSGDRRVGTKTNPLYITLGSGGGSTGFLPLAGGEITGDLKVDGPTVLGNLNAARISATGAITSDDVLEIMNPENPAQWAALQRLTLGTDNTAIIRVSSGTTEVGTFFHPDGTVTDNWGNRFLTMRDGATYLPVTGGEVTGDLMVNGAARVLGNLVGQSTVLSNLAFSAQSLKDSDKAAKFRFQALPDGTNSAQVMALDDGGKQAVTTFHTDGTITDNAGNRLLTTADTSAFLPASGGTITNDLTVDGKLTDKAGDLYVTNVDMSKYLPLTGGEITGNLKVDGTTTLGFVNVRSLHSSGQLNADSAISAGVSFSAQNPKNWHQAAQLRWLLDKDGKNTAQIAVDDVNTYALTTFHTDGTITDNAGNRLLTTKDGATTLQNPGGGTGVAMGNADYDFEQVFDATVKYGDTVTFPEAFDPSVTPIIEVSTNVAANAVNLLTQGMSAPTSTQATVACWYTVNASGGFGGQGVASRYTIRVLGKRAHAASVARPLLRTVSFKAQSGAQPAPTQAINHYAAVAKNTDLSGSGPFPVIGWSRVMTTDPRVKWVALHDVTETEWKDPARYQTPKALVKNAQGGWDVTPYAPRPAPVPLALQARSRLRQLGPALYEQWGMMGTPAPADVQTYVASLRAIAAGKAPAGTPLPATPADLAGLMADRNAAPQESTP
ncbi:hypothetical protein [Oecophyllibacter saccharovorans]|uniref:Uncharacterized protein n=1 Tax=Oecophyllibacter saccharovorans TaxID=2558360 RepID=A0A506UM16_9PROT|nr:hypothetical protein [Oecophyllibacter saccharovorans]TPW34394.1 hypothetical protein E3202_07875 [Oecophyllibacter saccharovorans]